ncbi:MULTISPECIES: YqzH family protein [Neobacillus]|jgi:hypothetical protein|uniref:Uncharacterized protein n=2 Tax=Neobacillus TaxID=2675232 RepID=A0A6B3TPP6_9BACI|nr:MULTISPECIES: YqzH family protein [Neobacillus]AIM15527.1 hypothetical protein HW35_03805 [Bacillus sp. X1(2014)]MCD4839597.1 hypothetical protein [Neobacillus sedimentimangrovi]MED3624937.1 YqzH family protein [Neobacillus thermocopriae]MED3713884.1 YqzH family protein [Neobacillus thermocopriae]NEX78783.1 hypothetical protein [Neobacillus thermocopriae]
MEKKLVIKMIRHCFKQYGEVDPLPVGEKEMEDLVHQILQIKNEDPAADLYEVVNDAVYEYLTG